MPPLSQVLGKRFDPAGDTACAKVSEIESQALKVSDRMAEVAKELTDLEDGHLDKKHHQQALKVKSTKYKIVIKYELSFHKICIRYKTSEKLQHKEFFVSRGLI